MGTRKHVLTTVSYYDIVCIYAVKGGLGNLLHCACVAVTSIIILNLVVLNIPLAGHLLYMHRY